MWSKCPPPPPITVNFNTLSSADDSPWTEQVSTVDQLPIRPSGSWIDKKHRLLTYYAKLFSTGMKFRWADRIYLELFSGPGRCYVRENGTEDLGSPLKVIDADFTRFIFVERSVAVARALEHRLASYPNARLSEIWCGDCAQAIDKISFPGTGALTFAFIDPTGIAHAPFSLIKKLHSAVRCDLLINIQHGMGIKMNLHQYTPDVDEQSALTRFLGHDRWKKLLPATNAGDFFRSVLDLYKDNLRGLGYKFIGREVLFSTSMNTPLYLLLYASKHAKGEEFWTKALKGVQDPELGLMFN
jgi:three-Cys-motif partner protein